MAAKIGFYAGSFDPLPHGHLDVIRAASRFCDRLIIAIGVHPGKTPMFSADERAELIRAAWRQNPGSSQCSIEVATFDGLAVTAAASLGAQFLVRGLRDGTDFDYEMQMAGMNGTLSAEIETIFIPARPETRHVTATLVRQIASMGGNISGFVPGNVAEALYQRVQQRAKTQGKS